jgi:hypothetical protein
MLTNLKMRRKSASVVLPGGMPEIVLFESPAFLENHGIILQKPVSQRERQPTRASGALIE